MKTFDLCILAADKPFFQGACESIVLPTTQGQYGILASHRNTVAAIVPGVLKYCTADGEECIASVSEGIVKVEDGEVLVLVDTIERPEEIDTNAEREQIERAKEELLQKQSIADYHATCARMARSIARLKIRSYKNL